MATRPGAQPVQVRLCGWGEQADLVRRGEVDAAIVYEPDDHRSLDDQVLLLDPRVAALPAHHPLAGRPCVSTADLATTAEALDTQAEQDITAHGVEDLAQLLARVGLGEAATVLPLSVAQRYPRPGVAHAPIQDAPPAVLTIAWHEDAHSLATAALVEAATAIADRSTHPARPRPTGDASPHRR